MKMYDVTSELERLFGPEGSETWIKAEDKAWEEYNAQLLLLTRKKAHLTQSQLAQKIGKTKSFVSRIERGLTVPSISTFYRMIAAMGFEVRIV